MKWLYTLLLIAAHTLVAMESDSDSSSSSNYIFCDSSNINDSTSGSGNDFFHSCASDHPTDCSKEEKKKQQPKSTTELRQGRIKKQALASLWAARPRLYASEDYEGKLSKAEELEIKQAAAAAHKNNIEECRKIAAEKRLRKLKHQKLEIKALQKKGYRFLCTLKKNQKNL